MTTSAIPQPSLSRAVGAVLALAFLMAAMVLTAAPADAHARLEGSSPQDGATLTAVPPEVVLRFNEPIKEGLNQVSVTSGSTDVAKGEPQVDGSNVYQPVEYTMDPGEYTVTYKVVSADGHPVSGSFSFTYAPPQAEGGAGQDPEATPFSPSESSPAEEPSESASEEPSATATSEPSESGSEGPSESPSESSSSDESATSEGESAAETPQDEQDAADTQERTSPWWWALAAGALVLVVGGLVLLVRGRRDAEDEDGFYDE